MKFSLVALYVKDFEKSFFFYNSLLKLPVIRRLPGIDGKELVFLGDEDNVSLELIPANAPQSYSGFNLGFEVKDLAAVKGQLLENGYPILDEMIVNPHTTICFLEGPNGEKVELIEYK